MKISKITSLEDIPLDKNRQISLVVSDIDYTLVDFDKSHQLGLKALASTFGSDFAVKVNTFFDLILEGSRKPVKELWSLRHNYDGLINKTQELQKIFLKTYGLKVWSREVWVILAAEELKMPLTKTEVENARNTYWQASKTSNLYKDAEVFLNNLKEFKIPLFLMTGSDSIMQVQNDLSLEYNPKYSEEYKRKRLCSLSLESIGLVTGDPIDKPEIAYFQKLFSEVTRFGDFNRENILIVGDSERNDLEIPKEMGYKTLLIKRS